MYTRLCFSYIITFVGQRDAYMWQGYLYIIALFAVNCLKTVFNVWYWHVCYETGMRVRTAVIAIIYRKVSANRLFCMYRYMYMYVVVTE